MIGPGVGAAGAAQEQEGQTVRVQPLHRLPSGGEHSDLVLIQGDAAPLLGRACRHRDDDDDSAAVPQPLTQPKKDTTTILHERVHQTHHDRVITPLRAARPGRRARCPAAASARPRRRRAPRRCRIPAPAPAHRPSRTAAGGGPRCPAPGLPAPRRPAGAAPAGRRVPCPPAVHPGRGVLPSPEPLFPRLGGWPAEGGSHSSTTFDRTGVVPRPPCENRMSHV